MSAFDQSLALSDLAAFSEMAEPVLLGGLRVLGIVSPDLFGNNVDSGGGISREESIRLEVRKSDLANSTTWSGPEVGMSVTVEADAVKPRNYRVRSLKHTGATFTLFCGSTAGTAVQF
jgi:hypothetical protein